MFGPPAADENPDHERHHAEDAPNSDAERAQLFGIFVQQHGLADRENDAAGEAKQNARGHEKVDRFAHGANEREDGIKRIGRDQSAVSAESGRDPARERKAQREADHMVRRRPSAEARRHALQIARRIGRDNRIARHIGQHDDIAESEHDVEQQETPSAQGSGVAARHD